MVDRTTFLAAVPVRTSGSLSLSPLTRFHSMDRAAASLAMQSSVLFKLEPSGPNDSSRSPICTPISKEARNSLSARIRLLPSGCNSGRCRRFQGKKPISGYRPAPRYSHYLRPSVWFRAPSILVSVETMAISCTRCKCVIWLSVTKAGKTSPLSGGFVAPNR